MGAAKLEAQAPWLKPLAPRPQGCAPRTLVGPTRETWPQGRRAYQPTTVGPGQRLGVYRGGAPPPSWPQLAGVGRQLAGSWPAGAAGPGLPAAGPGARAMLAGLPLRAYTASCRRVNGLPCSPGDVVRDERLLPLVTLVACPKVSPRGQPPW
jgi:hypothetical protein